MLIPIVILTALLNTNPPPTTIGSTPHRGFCKMEINPETRTRELTCCSWFAKPGEPNECPKLRDLEFERPKDAEKED